MNVVKFLDLVTMEMLITKLMRFDLKLMRYELINFLQLMRVELMMFELKTDDICA